jgi:hypothetical protein
MGRGAQSVATAGWLDGPIDVIADEVGGDALLRSLPAVRSSKGAMDMASGMSPRNRTCLFSRARASVGRAGGWRARRRADISHAGHCIGCLDITRIFV